MKKLTLLIVLLLSAPAMAAFVNQKCDRLKGQAGPTETDYLRVFYGPAPKLVPCRVEVERNLGGTPKANIKKSDYFKAKNQAASCDQYADRQKASWLKKGFTCVNE